ncbi:MAG: hypothetical protein H7836_11265 [Magnetococcus sp. YQC-3]
MQLTTSDTEDMLLTQAISLWGDSAQMDMACEECGELISAINQFKRGRITKEQVIDEIADVTILMAQMANMFGADEVQKTITKKMYRLIERLSKAEPTY